MGTEQHLAPPILRYTTGPGVSISSLHCDQRLPKRHSPRQPSTRKRDGTPAVQLQAQGEGRQLWHVSRSHDSGCALPAWPEWNTFEQFRTQIVAEWPSDLVPKTLMLADARNSEFAFATLCSGLK